MTFFAITHKGTVIAPHQAKREEPYFCRECNQRVALRTPKHQRAHFFHIQSSSCSSAGKGALHLAAQLAIAEQIQGAKIEVPFPSIARIADIAWEEKKIVIEVQCAPITKQEVLLRNQDYNSLGWDVVWIFHTHRYGKKKLYPAEKALFSSPHYYCTYDEQGNGEIFDRACWGVHDTVVEELRLGPVQISCPIYNQESLYFAGSCKDRLHFDPAIQKQIKIWKRQQLLKSFFLFLSPYYDRWVKEPALALWNLYREKNDNL